MKNEGIFNRFYEGRMFSELTEEIENEILEKKQEVFWDIYDTDWDEYLMRFAGVRPGSLFRTIQETASRKPLYGLELAGYGYMFESEQTHFTAGVHVALSDPLSALDPSEKDSAKRFFVKGDVLDGNTWRKLSVMKKVVTKKAGFDVIIFSAYGGSKVIGGNEDVHDGITALLTQKCWPLLSQEDGHLLISYTSSSSNLGNWITNLDKIEGISGRFMNVGAENYLYLNRTLNYQGDLPRFN